MNFFMSIVSFAFILSSNLVKAGWHMGSSNMPISLSQAAVAVQNNNTILFIGGLSGACLNCALFVEYNIVNDTFYYDQTTIPNQEYGDGKFYQQMGDILYIAKNNIPWLHIFDLSSKILTQNQINIPIDTQNSADLAACITGIDDILYLIGGYNGGYANNLQMLNLSDTTWSNGPSITYPRATCSCIISPKTNTLYAIAGKGFLTENTVEYISINDIQNNTWQFTPSNFPEDIAYQAPVILNGDEIMLIGGSFNNQFLPKVYVINIYSNQISSAENLVYRTSLSMTVRIKDIIYAFGGFDLNHGQRFNTWQYYSPPTPQPSINPTTVTSSPSNNPTITRNYYDADINYEWQDKTITCHPDKLCTVICDMSAACSRSTVICPMNYSCDIICSGTYSCRDIEINPPQNYSLLTLTWSGFESLRRVKYPPYRPVNYDYKQLNVTCNNMGQCSYMEIICPSYAKCNIFCVAERACEFINISWPKLEGMGSIICEGESACTDLDFPIPEPDSPFIYSCDAQRECHGVNIYCPTNATCDIYCNGGCFDTGIYCPSYEYCSIVCNSSSACSKVYVHSPFPFNWYCSDPNGCVAPNLRIWSGPITAPSQSPITAIPTFYPSQKPSNMPTNSPSVAPIPYGITPSPTYSYNQIFIDKNGCDCNQICNNKINSCLTISYAYNCFMGDNGCDSEGYDGQGIINLGDGDWHWPFELIFSNQQIIINGNGIKNTFLYYNHKSFIGCVWYKCWIEINNLTLMTNATSDSSNQIAMKYGGTIKFSNILFDGNNYAQNQNEPFWLFNDERTHFEFKQCVFINNNATFLFLNGVTGT
eukprot:543609_1